MKNSYKLVWSYEALTNLQHIIDYLESFWTERELRNFAQLLQKNEIMIITLFDNRQNPNNLNKKFDIS